MNFIDTHAHLSDFVANGTLPEVLNRARKNNVARIITCSTTPSEWILYRDLCKEHSDILSWEIGIHPTEIKPDDDLALDALSSFFIDSQTAPVAIGEIGLDFYRMTGSPAENDAIKNRQIEIFRRQLRIANDLDCKICVHARDAVRESIDIISQENVNFSNVVFHCFSGTNQELKELNALGARASFTGVITYKNAAPMRENMISQGLQKLMFETDCPYLAPMPLRGKQNEPANIPLTASFAAKEFGISIVDMARITTENAFSFFCLR